MAKWSGVDLPVIGELGACYLGEPSGDWRSFIEKVGKQLKLQP